MRTLQSKQWPGGLRRKSAATSLLRLWVRIPPGSRMSVVSVAFCKVQVLRQSDNSFRGVTPTLVCS